MMWDIILVSGGAVAGALLRWCFAITFNPIFPTFPLGTAIANLLGGLLIGLVIELTRTHSFLSEYSRVIITTGFLGALTTFSTFSAEVVILFIKNEFLWAAILVGVHLVGSLSLTIIGMLIVKWSLGL